jgi:hypothetical protein
MIPSSPVLRRPSRRIVLLTKIKSTATGLGARTMSFFRKGEELEATEYENLPYDDPTLVPPKLGFRDFDRVPRNRAPLMIAFVVVAVGALSVLGWRSFRRLPAEPARVATPSLSEASR